MTRYLVWFSADITVDADSEEEAEGIAKDLLTLADVLVDGVEEV